MLTLASQELFKTLLINPKVLRTVAHTFSRRRIAASSFSITCSEGDSTCSTLISTQRLPGRYFRLHSGWKCQFTCFILVYGRKKKTLDVVTVFLIHPPPPNICLLAGSTASERFFFFFAKKKRQSVFLSWKKAARSSNQSQMHIIQTNIKVKTPPSSGGNNLACGGNPVTISCLGCVTAKTAQPFKNRMPPRIIAQYVFYLCICFFLQAYVSSSCEALLCLG